VATASSRLHPSPVGGRQRRWGLLTPDVARPGVGIGHARTAAGIDSLGWRRPCRSGLRKASPTSPSSPLGGALKLRAMGLPFPLTLAPHLDASGREQVVPWAARARRGQLLSEPVWVVLGRGAKLRRVRTLQLFPRASTTQGANAEPADPPPLTTGLGWTWGNYGGRTL